MFGFNKKPAPPKRERKRDPSEFGIFGISDNLGGIGDDVDDGSDEDDDALEAELAAIAAGSSGGRKARPKPKAKGIVAPQELDAMVAASLRDIGSDDEDGDDDEDDSELLNELTTITGGVSLDNDDDDDDDGDGGDATPPARSASSGSGLVALIKSRITMYTQAEENAKKAGDSSKARRFNRGLKTLKDQLRLAEAGKPVAEADIPPEVSVKIANAPAADDTPKPATAPVRPAPPPPVKSPKPEPEPEDIAAAGPSKSPPPVPARRQSKPPQSPAPVLGETSPTVDNPKLQMLNERKAQYKQAAVMAKKAGDNVKALAYVKVLKQFDLVLAALEKGEEVDLSRMPPPPAELSVAEATSQPTVPSTSKPKEEEKLQQDAEVPSPSTPMAPAPGQPAEAEDEDEGEENLIQASTVLEALEQRLEKYKSVEQAAKDEGNSSKARRMGRIVKQYQDAIKLHKAGKPIPVDELPTPPGYGPIPVDGPPKPAPPAIPVKPAPAPKPAQPTSPASPPVPGTSKSSPKPPATTQFEKQLALLLERQQQYRQAAVEAKKAGELDEAKEFLRVFKGLEKMVEIARAGGRVDLSTIPIAPAKRQALEASFTIVSTDDCEQAEEAAPAGSDVQDVDSETRIRLEEQLSKQLIMCRNTRDHHRAIGDVAGMNKFENLALNVQKDLDLVRLGHRRGLPLPKFHYEKLQFNVVKCNTDLSDNEIEITIVRGINYNVANPKDVDTYVKFEFPYPQEDPIKGRTNIVKDTHSPDYNYQQTIELQRSQRNCQRIFKRHALKCEVYSKGRCCSQGASNGLFSCFSGFLRSDALIGTVSVKLQPLETQIELHDSFPLMDGRRTVGGKLEVKIRVRNPILTKQIEQINERWVVFDS
uniref:Coiled-coil and C2 domain-containing protein 1-like n=1 Tax=Anopheles triannulatus TaxID=58253 RepID=A0A2M4AEX3_9DIPT